MTAWLGPRLYCDQRIYGVERWVWGNPRKALVRVPDTIRDCTLMLGIRTETGAVRRIATGFFVGVPVGVPPLHEYDHHYLVTARHVVEGASRIPGELCVVVNTRGGGALAVTIDEPWYFPDNPASDVAVTHMVLNTDRFQYLSLASRMFATEEAITQEGIGVGDELVAVGLFVHHMGTQRNLPIVRSGIIASMPHEPLMDDPSGEPYHAYLAELRSIGGLSGSPVFALLPPNRIYDADSMTPRETTGMFTFFLLGLIRGHWDQSEGDASYRAEREMFNTGIAKVTPVTEVLEVLDREELVRQRKQIERDEVAKRGKSTFDSLGAEGDEFERFENLARRLVSVPKKEIDEKRKESGGE